MRVNARICGSFLVLAVLAAGIAFLGACKKADEKASEKIAENMLERMIEKGSGGKAKVDLDEGKFKIQTDEGTAEISESGEWPKDLPADVPVFKLGIVKAVWKATGEGQRTWTITLDRLAKNAMNQYIENLRAGGWKIESTFTMDEGSGTFSAVKGSWNLIGTFSGDEQSGGLTIGFKEAEKDRE